MKKISIIIILILLIIPFTCQAIFWDGLFEELEDIISNESSVSEGNNVQIINEVNVSASTGNNIIEGGSGEIIEGEPKTSVEIKTIINEEEVESISTESNEGSISVESRIEVNQEGIVNKELRIKDTVRNWFSDFVENLKLIFWGIFNIF